MKRIAVIEELEKHKNSGRAVLLSRYFKTGKGQYAQGDMFIGLTVPLQRQIANTYRNLDLSGIETLLRSPIHEYRLTALIILTLQFSNATPVRQKELYDFYLAHTTYVNNWDLVDLSAPRIIGGYLLERKPMRRVLYRLAKSVHLWERRSAIMATFPFLRAGDFADTFAISTILLHDPHDLIHKAVGWMLREVGKVNRTAEETFLEKHSRTMPRTMLRYAIEKFSDPARAYYLSRRTAV